MITKDQVIPLLLAACPAAGSAWEKHLAYWGEDTRGAYIDAAAFVQFLVEAYERGDTASLSAAFAALECVLVEGDDDAWGLATVGVVETIQNIAGWKPYGAEPFKAYLGPGGLGAWEAVDLFWQGDVNAITREFFQQRAGDARPEDLAAFLAAAPDVPPEPGDEIPDELVAKLRQLRA